MIIKLKEILPSHEIKTEDSDSLYIVDYKHINSGDVEIFNIEPSENYVYLSNKNNTPIYFDGFKDNSLEITRGNYSRQCECVLFPQNNENTYWVLFIETKYVTNIQNAFRVENDYPNCMVEQIIETVNFFRTKKIIDSSKRVKAIVSFPKLIQDFDASFFTGKFSIEEILEEHNIIIRATNKGEIVSAKRINI